MMILVSAPKLKHVVDVGTVVLCSLSVGSTPPRSSRCSFSIRNVGFAPMDLMRQAWLTIQSPDDLVSDALKDPVTIMMKVWSQRSSCMVGCRASQSPQPTHPLPLAQYQEGSQGDLPRDAFLGRR